MQPSRFQILGMLVGAVVLEACGSSPEAHVATTHTDQLGTPGVPDAADTGCNVFLRDIADNETGSVETHCVPGDDGGTTCWVVFSGHLDISNEALLEGDQPYVQYQSGSDPSWYSVPAMAITGAGTGFQRYTFSITEGTAVQGQPFPTVQVIPYLITTVGTHLYDHNVYADQNYVLDANNSWDIQYNGDYCYEPPPPGTGTVTFNAGWTDTASGTFVQGGKLVVNYDLARMPECEGVTTDGVAAWATTANARFLPGGETFTGAVNGPYDPATYSWTSELFERDIPTDATRVQLWFETSGDGCQTGWDSDYGQNYSFSIVPASF